MGVAPGQLNPCDSISVLQTRLEKPKENVKPVAIWHVLSEKLLFTIKDASCGS
jgi:hypothetical protein